MRPPRYVLYEIYVGELAKEAGLNIYTDGTGVYFGDNSEPVGLGIHYFITQLVQLHSSLGFFSF